MANGKRGSGGRKKRNQNRSLGFNLSSLASNREKTQSEKNRAAKLSSGSNTSTSTTTNKPVDTALSRSLAYYGDSEKGQQRIKETQDAVKKFKGDDKKKKKNIVSNASVTKGGTKSLGKSQTFKEKQDAGKKASDIINKKNPKLEMLRKKLGLTGDITIKDVASAVKGKLPDLVALGKKGKKDLTKRGRRIDARIDRRARRRAKDLKNTTDYDKAVGQEKDLIRKRRAGRQQFLRNFASQLTTGENAPAQARNFEGRKKDFYNNQSTAATEGDKAEVEQNTNQFTDLLNTTSNDNSNFNNLLTPSTEQPDPGNFLGTTSVSNFYKPGEFAVSPNLKVEEDSTPISAMRKEYNKKRGF